MNKYELMVLVAPKATEAESKKTITSLVKAVKEVLGTELKEDFWGEKELAYKIGKHTKAIYTVINFEADSDKVKELPKALNIQDSVIRYLITKLDK